MVRSAGLTTKLSSHLSLYSGTTLIAGHSTEIQGMDERQYRTTNDSMELRATSCDPTVKRLRCMGFRSHFEQAMDASFNGNHRMHFVDTNVLVNTSFPLGSEVRGLKRLWQFRVSGTVATVHIQNTKDVIEEMLSSLFQFQNLSHYSGTATDFKILRWKLRGPRGPTSVQNYAFASQHLMCILQTTKIKALCAYTGCADMNYICQKNNTKHTGACTPWTNNDANASSHSCCLAFTQSWIHMPHSTSSRFKFIRGIEDLNQDNECIHKA